VTYGADALVQAAGATKTSTTHIKAVPAVTQKINAAPQGKTALKVSPETAGKSGAKVAPRAHAKKIRIH
jgi:hypothetical protein